ncbi:MAG: 2Fe-2S iron-sulfur cluster-binding protein [Saprospiraceae bacterium]
MSTDFKNNNNDCDCPESSEDIICVKVIDRDDTSHCLEAPTDMAMNMMEVCKSYELPVEGTCGGMALCASCHMYVLSDHDLPEPTEDEENMLDQAFFVKSNSRLGCQIKIHTEIDGLVVKLAPVSPEV